MAFSNTTKSLRKVGGLIASELSKNLIKDNAVASGKLNESIEVRAFDRGSKFGIDIMMLDYWDYVDKGRKAGKMPPVGKIEQWLSYPNVRDKLSGFRDKPVQNPQSLAYVIARKIAREGTEGNNFATDVFESGLLEGKITDALENSLQGDIEQLLNEQFTNGNSSI